MCTSNLKPIEFHSDSSNIDNYFNHTFVTSNLAFVYVNGNKENYIPLGYHSNNGNHTESAFRFFEEDGKKKRNRKKGKFKKNRKYASFSSLIDHFDVVSYSCTK